MRICKQLTSINTLRGPNSASYHLDQLVQNQLLLLEIVGEGGVVVAMQWQRFWSEAQIISKR